MLKSEKKAWFFISRNRTFIFLFSLNHFFLKAQSPDFSYRHYSVDDGLPSSEVYHIFQDSKGFLWFATNNGVARFDGKKFERFSIREGLPDNTIFEIYEDHRNRIWFLSFSCKLSWYDSGKIFQFPHNDSIVKAIGTGPIRNFFYVDKKDNVHLNIKSTGYFRISPDGIIQKHRLNPKENYLHTKHYYRVREMDPERFFVNEMDTVVSESTVEVNLLSGKKAIYSSPHFTHRFRKFSRRMNGNFILMYDEQVLELNASGASVFCGLSNVIWVSEDRSQNTWLGVQKGGGYYLRSPAEKFTGSELNFLKEFSVSSVLHDHEGGFWISTLENGVYYTSTSEFITHGDEEGKRSLKAICIAANGSDTLFSGLEDGKVFMINAKTGERKKYEFTSVHGAKGLNDEVNGVYFNPYKNETWFNTNEFTGKITGVASGIRVEKVFNDKYIYKMAFTAGDTIFFYRHDRFMKYIHNKVVYDSWLKTGINFRATSLLKDSRNRLLVGGLNGLYEFTGNTFRMVTPENKLLRYRTASIQEFALDTLLIATRGGGLIIFLNFSKTLQINRDQGLSGDNVSSLLVHGRDIWLSTDKGINKITLYPGNGKLRYSIETFTKMDGLISNEVNQLAIAGDKIWAATNKGITEFSLKWKKPYYLPPLIHITGLKVMDRDTQPGPVTLSYNTNFLQFRFIGLSFKDPDNILYRYKVMGMDNEWRITRQNELPFPSVAPGSYRFIVQASNDGRTWSKVPAEMDFTIIPPFWQQWWFRGIILLASAFSIVMFYRVRINRERMKRQMVELESKALRAQMNPHFIFNSLNSIQSFISSNENYKAESYLSRFARLMRKILDNSRSTFIMLASEVQVLNDYLELEKMRFGNKFSYSIVTDPTLDAEITLILPMLIQPFVENAVLHGVIHLEGKEGKINIQFRRDGKAIRCTVEDNGVGRAATGAMKQGSVSLRKSHGTQISRERLNLIRTRGKSEVDIKITDKPQGNSTGGTIVEIVMPYELDQ